MTLETKKGFLGACLTVLLFAVMLVNVASPASAQGRQARCGEYAQDAVEAAEKAERGNCGFQGPRWGRDRGPHFGWCMLFPRQAEDEAAARASELRSCLADRGGSDRRGGGGREGKRANCDTYSSIAAVQAEANEKYKCGNRGGEWNTSKREHFGWCMTNKREFMIDEIRFRSQELQKCFNNLGDYDDDKWDRGYRRRFDNN
jgi:hypothetical protein